MTTVALKLGVSVKGLQPEALLGIFIASKVYEVYGEFSMVVTSVTDGVHKKDSLHYKGMAFDLRLPRNTQATVVVRELQIALRYDYDVVLEADHIHVEFDPK